MLLQVTFKQHVAKKYGNCFGTKTCKKHKCFGIEIYNNQEMYENLQALKQFITLTT
jgi:hypothetical protein